MNIFLERLLFYIILFLWPFMCCKGQNTLSTELYEKEFPVLRSFKNKRIENIKNLREKMILVPPYTEDGAKHWREFLDYVRQSLIIFPLDTYDRDDEEYWNQTLATLYLWFYVMCDELIDREKEAYDNSLVSKNFLYHQFKSREIKQVTWEDVRDALDDKEVAIELRAMPEEVLILKKNAQTPISIRIDSVMAEHLGSYKGEDELEISEMYKPNGLLSQLWATLSPAIADCNRIYLSASNFLCNFNYGAIPTRNGSTVGEEYDYHYLVSTAEIKELKKKPQQHNYNKAALFGNITYDVSDDQMKSYASNGNDYSKALWDLTRGMDDDTRGKLYPLKYSEQEIESLQNMLSNHSIKTYSFSKELASEAAFKEVIKESPDIIHLSTHGYMLTTMYNGLEESKRFTSSSSEVSKYATDLLRSGLFLSGASRIWNGKEPIKGIEDGILTSKEILEMDFHGVKLVVLSACKTGLGNDTNLMGFSLGPQHAFKVKGANQLLMSLWMVDDAATSLLMQYFYEGILSGKEARYALQEAQHKMISSGYKDAYYWAGFIILD